MEINTLQIKDLIKQSLRTTKASSVDSNVKKITTDQYRGKIFQVCPGFKVDDGNKDVVNELFAYVNEESSKFDSRKGILFFGDIGTGKSTLTLILAEALRIKGQGYKTVNCSYLATQYAAYGLDALNESTYNEIQRGAKNPVTRAFDELGREPVPAKYYGNDLNVMQYVIQCRYELRYQVRTFATTNLHPQALEKLYGAYIADRIYEMFNIVELNGRSRRK